MAANQAFQLEETRGWKMGLRNLMRKENGEWFKTRRWWIQLLIWLVLIDGFLLFLLRNLRVSHSQMLKCL